MTNKTKAPELPPIRKNVTLKVASVEKFIKSVPKTAEFKPALQVLKKMLVSYEKYEGDPDLAEARMIVANSILAAVGAFTLRMQANKARA